MSADHKGGMDVNDQPRVEAWRDREPLSGADLSDFIALRRVCGRADFRVLQVGQEFFQAERPLLPFVGDGVRGLIEVGHATLADPEPESGGARVVVPTAAGRTRYEQLCELQGIPPHAPASEGPTL